MTPSWLPALTTGDRAALARAITAVENETADAQAVLAAIQPHLGRARVIGVTGSPGAGKSTLVSALVGRYRQRGRTVGVVAVDPSSPLSGGALLGDRVRMSDHAGDPGVFVRSLASRGHVGGLSRTTARVVDVMDAAGREIIIVETVGAGQSEVEIAGLAQTRLVVLAPGMGDDIQAVKAGILEIADILVVNKADQPMAQATAAQLSDMVAMTGAEWSPPVRITSAVNGTGVAELVEAIDAHGDWLTAHPRGLDPQARTRHLLAGLAGQRLTDALRDSRNETWEALLTRVARGEIDFDSAAREALRIIAQAP
ncbi:methylmalonyl Co-A mutase-associated GTPase MeaB [Magnetospira thiophila]